MAMAYRQSIFHDQPSSRPATQSVYVVNYLAPIFSTHVRLNENITEPYRIQAWRAFSHYEDAKAEAWKVWSEVLAVDKELYGEPDVKEQKLPPRFEIRSDPMEWRDGSALLDLDRKVYVHNSVMVERVYLEVRDGMDQLKTNEEVKKEASWEQKGEKGTASERE